MTVGELIELVPENKRKLELAVVKCDKNQLPQNSTVLIKSGNIGYDWTSGQFVLEPVVNLVVDPDSKSNELSSAVEYFAERVARARDRAAEVSKMVEDLQDAELKMKIRSKLAEI